MLISEWRKHRDAGVLEGKGSRAHALLKSLSENADSGDKNNKRWSSPTMTCLASGSAPGPRAC